MQSLSTSRHLYRGSLHGNEYHIWHSRHQFQPVATISGSPTRPHFCGSIIIPGVESRLMGQCRFTVPTGMWFIARSISGGHGARIRQLVHPGYPSGCTYSIVKVQGFLAKRKSRHTDSTVTKRVFQPSCTLCAIICNGFENSKSYCPFICRGITDTFSRRQ